MKLKECSLIPIVPFWQIETPIDWTLIFGRTAPLKVEIGFGMGEVLQKEASDHPEYDYVGIEEHKERIFKTLSRMTVDSRKTAYPNLKILKIDAWLAFLRFFNEKSIDDILCLFPCPWPKERHEKHRLFSGDFLKLLNSRLKEKGQIRLVTDAEKYFNWVKDQITEETGFTCTDQKIPPQFETKFEKKWCAAGHKEFFEIIFTKIKHVSYSIEKDVHLKAYKLSKFIPEKFAFESTTLNEVTVVLKDFLFDENKKRGLIRVIVNEQHLTQNFWGSIAQRQDKAWIVSKADGQQFIATQGTAIALEIIYQAALNTSENNEGNVC